jgi:RHS repeat-associated protein
MRVIQERSINGVPTVAYTRGPDLSGTLEGAGGIGGLLARSEWNSVSSTWSHAFYHSDGVGNVTALAVPSGNDIALAGSYRYDPFGRLIGTHTGLAARNTQRFSSKDWHNPSGFYYFGYRFYDPATQRWLNRDPMGEEGGVNLYGYVGNNPINNVDPDGRAALPVLLPVLAGAMWVSACHHYAIENARNTFPDDDKKQHCFAACWFNRCILSAPGLTALGALWQEIGTDQLFSEPGEAIDDIKAGLYGIAKSYSFSSCKDQCDKCPVK